MTGAEFLSDPGALLAAFTSLCEWAEEIIVCTPRIDVGEGWRALKLNIVKIRLCLVSDRAPGLPALKPLHDKGALRLVEGHGLRYRPNVYLFRRGAEARALVGSARLTESGFGTGVESVARVEGTRDEPFACALDDFIEACLARCRLPTPGDLSPEASPPADSDEPNVTKHPTRDAKPLPDARVERLLPLQDAEAVRSAQHDLWSVIVANGTRLTVEVGRRRTEAFWNLNLGFWAARLESSERCCYVFGARDPRGLAPPNVTLILNIPEDRYDPKSSGAFAIDPERQRVFLVHRGGFGGSGNDGKRLFWQATRLRRAKLVEDGHRTRVAMVAELNTPVILEQLAAYVHDVARLTALGRHPADDGALTGTHDGSACEPFAEVPDADERASLVWQQLLGLSVVSKDEAVRAAAYRLRDEGRADFRRLDSSGSLYEAVLDSIDRGIRLGLLDRPRRGFVRAVLEAAQHYPEWLWQSCLLAALDREFVTRDEAVRRAAEWAVEHVGLRHRILRSGGTVDNGLRRALTRAIRQGQVGKQGRDLVRLAEGP